MQTLDIISLVLYPLLSLKFMQKEGDDLINGLLIHTISLLVTKLVRDKQVRASENRF